MSSIQGLLFPGQGAQFVGMGADLYDKYPQARDVYDRACDVLETDIRKLSFEGPDQTLRQTRYTQPAVLTHSLAVLALLPEQKPAYAAGHSLGEYSALYAAGALDFDSVMKLVKRRGELMWEEGDRNPGTMAAIIGLSAEEVEQLCQDVEGIVVPANYNEPTQTVVSGEVPAVEKAAALATERGATKAVTLPVSGAFHSPLLEQSGRSFAGFLDRFKISSPSFPVIANVSGVPVAEPDIIRDALSRQLTSPVRWTETMTFARGAGCTEFLEVGPGRILMGLARRIDRSLKVTPVGTVDQVKALLG
ncbi:MAG: ACP S-malonyltransferase [candidate division WOR-3 bacterium]|nr:MAG: ACP S-malonyltransferase [candidate division WOR-3 bacterium]